jgi:HK97 family phage portal protein
MIRKAIEYLLTKSGFARPEPWLRDTLGIQDTWSGAEISPENSLQSSAVAACVRLLSESVASLPLFVYRRTDDDKAKAPDHPLYAILHDQPNDYQSSYTWRAQLMTHVLLYGNAYSIIDRDDSGRVRALWPMHPSNVTVKAVDGRLEYEVWQNGKRATYAPEDVLHVKGPTIDGLKGMSIISMARQGIGLDQALAQHGASTFKNGGRPGLIVKTPQVLNNEARKQFVDAWSGQFAGALRAGKTALVDGGFDVQEIKSSNDDAQFLQSRQFSVQEIARWFRVSAHMIGDPSRLAYASSEVEMLSFLQHSLRPWLCNLEAEINRTLLPWRTSYFAEFSIDALQRADTKSRYESYAIGIDKGFLEVEDIRKWENLPPKRTPAALPAMIPAQPAPEVTADVVQ